MGSKWRRKNGDKMAIKCRKNGGKWKKKMAIKWRKNGEKMR